MSKKVYELANELNISSVDLVTKLRDLGFNVRNHMVALTEAEVESAMKALNPPSAEKDATKKKAIKKKLSHAKSLKKMKRKIVKLLRFLKKKLKLLPLRRTPEAVETVETASETGLEEEAKVAAAAKAKSSTVKRRSGGRKEEDEISEDGTRDIYRGDMPRGLSIVSRPVVAPKSETRDSDAPRDKNKVYKEKMHSFYACIYAGDKRRN
jgi:phosphatidate phosphatase APP1